MTYTDFRTRIQSVSDKEMDSLLNGTGVEFADVRLPKSHKTTRRFRKDRGAKNQWISFKKLMKLLQKMGRIG